MRSLGIDRLSVFGLPPLEFVALAAELGCAGISLTPAAPSGAYNPERYPDWSLRDDAALRRALVARADDSGVAIALFEGFAIAPNASAQRFAADLDLAAELGCRRIGAISFDPDLERTIDEFARLAEMAGDRGLPVSAEMGSLGPIGRVEPALAAVAGVGRTNFSLLIDSMHFFRLGNTLDQLAAIDPAVIGYAQLADAPLAPRFATYIEEAMFERAPPGHGELPLGDFVRLIPETTPLSLEIPLRSMAEAGWGPRARLAPCVAAARKLIDARAYASGSD